MTGTTARLLDGTAVAVRSRAKPQERTWVNWVTDAARVDRRHQAGSNRRSDFERRGSLVVGDVHPEVGAVAGALTPVPGSVGPLTVAMLTANTLKAAVARCSRLP